MVTCFSSRVTCSRADEPAVVGHSPAASARHVVVSTKTEALCDGGLAFLLGTASTLEDSFSAFVQGIALAVFKSSKQCLH